MTQPNAADDPTNCIIGEALRIHKVLGPGLLESTYEQCLVHALQSRGLKVRTQVILPLEFDSLFVPNAYRMDMVVNDRIIVEIKATDILTRAHFAQVLTYLKLARLDLALLINFNEALLKNGIKRIVNTQTG